MKKLLKGIRFKLNPAAETDEDIKTTQVSTYGTHDNFFNCPYCSTQNKMPRNVGLPTTRTCIKNSCQRQFKVLR